MFQVKGRVKTQQSEVLLPDLNDVVLYLFPESNLHGLALQLPDGVGSDPASRL